MDEKIDEAAFERAMAAVRRIGAAEARALAAEGRAELIDIRDASAYENAHIAGARSLPLAVIDASGGDLPADRLPPRDRLLVLYCA